MTDFSQLPDVVWCAIMHQLSLGDRYALAHTCRALHRVFHHPALWHRLELCLDGDGEDEDAVVYMWLVRKFGVYIRNLSVVLVGRRSRKVGSHADYARLLTNVCEHCSRLECLMLYVMVTCERSDRSQLGATTEAIEEQHALTNIVRSANNLRNFALTEWLPQTSNLDVLSVLMQNSNIAHLESISIYWHKADSLSWVALSHVLPSPQRVLSLVEQLPCLRVLRLRAGMLSDELLRHLCRTAVCIEDLCILVTSPRRSGGLPSLAANVWSQLAQRAPALFVHVSVASRVQSRDLVDFLNPSMPLASISFMRLSRCTTSDMEYVSNTFAASLRHFNDYSDTSGLDNAAVELVTKCQQIEQLEYNGQLHDTTVLTIARLRAGQWRRFAINVENMITLPRNHNDDIVIGKSEDDGSCYIVTHQMMLTEAAHNRDAALDHVSNELTQLLGRVWTRLNLPTCAIAKLTRAEAMRRFRTVWTEY